MPSLLEPMVFKPFEYVTVFANGSTKAEAALAGKVLTVLGSLLSKCVREEITSLILAENL